MKNLILLISLALGFTCQYPTTAQNELDAVKTKQIESFINTTMEEAGVVPGLGIAIVKGDRIVYANGFGLRDVENQLPVTAETGFYLASKTKSFLAMAAAQLESKQEISLDASLSTFYPDHKFLSPLDADKISLVNLLSHHHNIENSGLQYRLAFIDQMSNEDFMRVLFEFAREREMRFGYSNLGYNIMGNILENQTGKTWQTLIDEEVLVPAGLSHTTAIMTKAIQREFAYPYLKENDHFKKLKIKSDGQMQAAGGMVSTPKDLAKWIMIHMNLGKYEGRTIFPKAVMERIHQKYAPLERQYGEYQRHGYELGWYQADYDGDVMIHHFGSFEGYMAHVSYLPEHHIGVVALSNELQYGGSLPHLVANYIYDVLLGKENFETKHNTAKNEWLETIARRQQNIHPRLVQKKEMLEMAGTNPKDWQFDPSDFAGTFYNLRLGHFEVEVKEQGRLWSTFGNHRAELLPLDEGTFLVDWQLTGYATPPVELRAGYDASGNVRSLNWGGREFRFLTRGTTPAELNTMYSAFRSELETIHEMTGEEQRTFVNEVLGKYLPKGVLSESSINGLGYEYLNKNQTRLAITIFQFNVNHFPNSSNAHDSLGEAYLQAKDKRMAKKYYQKALELDEGNERIQKILEELN